MMLLILYHGVYTQRNKKRFGLHYLLPNITPRLAGVFENTAMCRKWRVQSINGVVWRVMSSIYVAATMISGKRKPTGIECAVSDCTLRNSDGVSLYTFPKDMRFRRQWVNFVRTNRANFIPSTYSRICSMHFASDCYPATYAIQESLGFTVKRKLLLPIAVPTIQKHEFSKPTPRKLNDEILRMNGNSVIPGISLPLPFAMASFTHTPDTSVNALLTGGLNTASYCATAPHEGVMKTVATAIQGAHTIRQLVSKQTITNSLPPVYRPLTKDVFYEFIINIKSRFDNIFNHDKFMLV